MTGPEYLIDPAAKGVQGFSSLLPGGKVGPPDGSLGRWTLSQVAR